ncbi:MAG: DegT/DnrJ/EryC1/StrS family aminotransferase [Phycisphaerae bacterium]
MKPMIPLARPDIGPAEIQAVEQVLRSGRLSIGPKLKAFERAVADRAGRKHGIGVNSGTSGLHLCVRGLGIGPGDEVITTPFSFIATANCILYENAKPVFVDIDPDSYNMDPDRIEQAITPDTKAILPVEVFGNTAHFDRYAEIAQKHGLKLIEDCCEAMGASLDGRAAGSFGDCGVFAFYPNKQITSGEGGIVVTDDDSFARLLRDLRSQGKSDRNACQYEHIGFNYRMTEFSAALGEQQMHRLDQILQDRRQVAEWYNDALADIDEIRLPPRANPQGASWFVYVIRLADNLTAEDRTHVLQHLHDENIGSELYFVPIHVQPYITRAFGYKRGDFPLTEALSARTIALPFFTSMTRQQIDRVADALKQAIATCPARKGRRA